MYSKAELYEKFENLPEEIQEAFLSIDTFNTIKKITDNHKLHIDQSGLLSEQIGFVMLGVTKPENFLSNIQEKLNITPEIAGEIVKEINTEIFFPIRTSLEKLNNSGSQYDNEKAPLVENFSPTGSVSEQNIYKPETPLQNSTNNAIIINEDTENITPKSDRQIFDEKMGKLFRLPKEEVDLGLNNFKEAEDNKERVSDPYREIPK